MELKKFISMEKPWEYNFEFECEDEEYKKLEPVERYFAYKITPGNTVYEKVNDYIDKHRRYLKIYDADGSGKCFYLLVHDIYNKLWGWERSNETFGNIKGWDSEAFWGCDTMNSVQTIFNSFARQLLESINGLPELKGKFSFNYILECWLSNQNFKNCLNREQKFKNFLNAYHTLGNFVLVPAGFNGQRGTSLKYGERKIDDYWDLSLEYLKDKDNGYGDFKSDDFKKYINYFFLWDYVKIEKNSYEIKPIGMEKLTDDRNLQEFFTEATKRILRRGKFMTAMLIIQSEESKGEKIYSDIQKKLQDQTLNGIKGAAEYILDEFADELKNNKFGSAEDILKNL